VLPVRTFIILPGAAGVYVLADATGRHALTQTPTSLRLGTFRRFTALCRGDQIPVRWSEELYRDNAATPNAERPFAFTPQSMIRAAGFSSGCALRAFPDSMATCMRQPKPVKSDLSPDRKCAPVGHHAGARRYFRALAALTDLDGD
jgi:hypothetical protein